MLRRDAERQPPERSERKGGRLAGAGHSLKKKSGWFVTKELDDQVGEQYTVG